MKKHVFLFLIAVLVCVFYQGVLHAATVEVSMIDFKFQPDPVMVNVGDSIVWKNNTAATPHTSTSGTNCTKDGKWDTGTIAPGQSSQPVVFNSAGNNPYYCIFHCALGMTGTVMVSGGTNTTTIPGNTTTTTPANTTTTASPTECQIKGIQPTGIRIGLGLIPRIRRVTLTLNVDLGSLGITCADLNIQNAPKGAAIISCAVFGDTIEALILFWGIQPGTYNLDLGPCGSIPFVISRF